MSKAVLDVLDNSKSVWGNKALLSMAYTRPETLCSDIDRMASKQPENDFERHTAAKEAARTELEDKLFITGRKLRAFARLQEDAVVEKQSDFSRSSLDILSLNNLLNLSRAICEVCKMRITQLEAYEIDGKTLTVLQESTDKLSSLNAHRDAVVDFRMENTSSIAARKRHKVHIIRKRIKI